MQTAFFNSVDAVYYSMFIALNDKPRLLNALLSLPDSAAAFAVFVMARVCLDASFFGRNLACAAAAIFGLTGASAVPTLATTITDIVPGARRFRRCVQTGVLTGRSRRAADWTTAGS